MLSKYLQDLTTFVSYKSVSTLPEHEEDIQLTAKYLEKFLSSHGFTVKVIQGYGNPIVLAEYVHDTVLPTCLVYGHYDVQVASAADVRKGEDPYKLTIQWDRVYGRWAVDNKWQIMIHMSTIAELMKEDNLKYNIKFLIEGDEETGDADMVRFTRDYKSALAANLSLISDGEIIGDNIPTMVKSFRWGANMTIDLQTSTSNHHSGLVWNLIPNSSYELIKILSKMHNDDQLIAIPGRYDGIELSKEVLADNGRIPLDMDHLQKTYGVRWTAIPKGYDHSTAVGLLPTIQVSGIESGSVSQYEYNDKKWKIEKKDGWYNNIIPGSALAKINFRFAPGQNPHHMINIFKKWFAANMPPYVDWNIKTDEPYAGTIINTDKRIVLDTLELLESIYQNKPLMKYCGGSLPIVELLQGFLGQDVLIVDLANEDCNMHGINENFKMNCIENWLEFSRKFFAKKV